jgi:hypothetical protein
LVVKNLFVLLWRLFLRLFWPGLDGSLQNWALRVFVLWPLGAYIFYHFSYAPLRALVVMVINFFTLIFYCYRKIGLFDIRANVIPDQPGNSTVGFATADSVVTFGSQLMDGFKDVLVNTLALQAAI